MQTIPAKTIVTKNKSTAWFGTEYNMNLYRGCNHGCIYCDSRSDCYQNRDFGTVKVKESALRIVRDNLARKVKKGVVGTGSMSDPYNPHEKEMQLTRNALQLLDAYGFGVAIATKGDTIVRDIDILKEIHLHSPVLCKITITAAQDDLAQKIEPAAPPSSARFAALRALASAGLFCGVLLMPVLPWLADSDENVLAIVEKAADAGARFIYPGFGLTQRSGQREYFYTRLEEQFPGQGLAQRYQKQFGGKYCCSSPRAKHLWEIFTEACAHHGLLYDMREIVRAYRQGRESAQLSLF